MDKQKYPTDLRIRVKWLFILRVRVPGIKANNTLGVKQAYQARVSKNQISMRYEFR